MSADVPDVVVVGGGIAGITAAIGAAKRGLRVTLLEGSPRLAGRARSHRDPETGDAVPIGPHIFLDESFYGSVFQLLDALGTRQHVTFQKDPRHFITIVDGQKETDINYLPLPAPVSFSQGLLNMIRDFPEIEQADVQSSVAVTLFSWRCSDSELLELDGESGISLLRRFNVTERFISRFYAFVSHAIFNVPIEEVSACALLRFVRILTGRSVMQIGFPDTGLGELFTPAERVLRELGADVRLRTEVASLEGTGTRCDGVVLETGEVLRPRVGVVLTLPAYQMSSLLHKEWLEASPALSAAAVQLKPCAYIAVYFWFDKKLTKKDFWARTFKEESLTCDWYDFSNIYAGWEDKPSFIGVNLIDTSARPVGKLSDEEIAQGCLEELCEYLPDARNCKLLKTQVQRVPCAIHRPVVGTEKLRIAPGRCASVEGLFFAGDWTDTGLPYSMESAASAGWAAAESLLKTAAEQGIETAGSTGLRVPVPGIDMTPKILSFLDVLRPFSVWLTKLRVGAERRQEMMRARL
mmetsp:Transcript_93597/g.165625  ORF Transcript_93597/g.165625 Transcript_93597/m.165625 type:complete len:523 (-) Transcript_93597:68-1636(-)